MARKLSIRLSALADPKALKANIESFFSKKTFKIKLDVDKSKLSEKLNSQRTDSPLKISKEEIQTQSAIQKALEKTILLRRKEEKAAIKAQAAAINKNFDKQYKEQQRLIDANTKSVKKLSNAIKVYADQGKLSKIETSEFTERLSEIETKGLSPIEKSNALEQLNLDLRTAADTTGLLGQSFGKAMVKYVTWLGIATLVSVIVNTLKQMVQEVINLDKAMVELNKVFDGTEADMQRVKDRAFELGHELGVTGEEVIKATTEFKRMGYTIDESLDLAKTAVMMTNVAEGITDTSEAANILTSILKGTNTEAKYSISLLDRLNEISNNNAVSFDALANMAKDSAATMKILGNNLDETMGLLTGAYEVLQDEGVAKGIQTIGLRIAGLNEDMETQVGLSNQVVEALQKYAGINAFDEQSGDLKSTYQILEELAGVWETIDVNQRSALLNTLAGKNQADVAASILNNWKGVSSAVEDAANSMGSAQKEQEKYWDSIEGRTKRIKNAVQNLADSVIGSDIVKLVLDVLESVVQLVSPLLRIVSLLLKVTGISGRLEGISAIIKIVASAFDSLADILEKGYEKAKPFFDALDTMSGGIWKKLWDKEQELIKQQEEQGETQLDLAETYDDAERELTAYEKAVRKLSQSISTLVAEQREELEGIKAEREQLKQQEEIEEKLLDIQQKRLALEQARQNKVRVYRAGVGFVYQEDTAGVQSAQSELTKSINDLADYRFDLTLERAEEFVDKLEELLQSDDVTAGWDKLFTNFGDLVDTEFSTYIDKARRFVQEFNNTIGVGDVPIAMSEIGSPTAPIRFSGGGYNNSTSTMNLPSMANNRAQYGTNTTTTLQFNGPLNFPNVRTASDAEGFINAIVQIGNNGIPSFN